MKAALFFQIVRLVLSELEALQPGDKNALDLEATLAELTQKVLEASKQHTGEALDPSLIKSESV